MSDKEEPAVNAPKPSYSKLFMFAEKKDKVIIILSALGAVCQGIMMPLMTFIFGELINVYIDYELSKLKGNPMPRNEFMDRVTPFIIYFCIMGCGSFGVSWFSFSGFCITAERQVKKLRGEYFKALLRQDISWYDLHNAGHLTSRVASDSEAIKEGLSDKFSQMIINISMFVSGLALAFFRGWKLALVLLFIFPLLAIAGGFVAKLLADASSKNSTLYAKAGFIAEEVISSIRTVFSYSAEKFESKRYVDALKEAEASAVKKSHLNGFGVGFMICVMFCSYGVAFWYGSVLKIQGEMDAGQVLNTFFSIMIGAMALGNAAPGITALVSASSAMGSVLEIIESMPKIDSFSNDGNRLKSVEGRIQFENVGFSYPSRPDFEVLKNFTLDINPGETIALVGSSGCGKSTVVQLMERFYDPTKGRVLLDGVDLKELHVQSLRQNIGLVSQEPILFSGTIMDNIKNGLEGITNEEVEKAAELANAHLFINSLPDQYNTSVGEQGVLLSGGQKQRIAIARALVKNPKILLLDEATAALDSSSEKIVQEALEKASKSRTTLIIAHRLSTVQNASKILVIESGEIVEQGTHLELLDKKGRYFNLVNAQNLTVTKTESTVEMRTQETPIMKTNAVEIVVKKTQADPEAKQPQNYILRVLNLNKPEWMLMLVGSIGAVVNGCVFPLFALVYAEMLDVFKRPDDELSKGAVFWALMFVALGVVSLLGNYVQIAFYDISAIRLTRRLRHLTFEAILRKPISYFDDKNNAVGILTAKLATTADLVKGASGQLLGLFVQAAATVISGLTIAFINGWALALIIMCVLPCMAFAQMIQMKNLQGLKEHKESSNIASQVVSESVQSIRTVVSMCLQHNMLNRYKNMLKGPYMAAVKNDFWAGMTFGVSQGAIFLSYAAAFYAGSRFIIDSNYDFLQMNTVMSAVMFTAMGIGNVSTFAPNLQKAKEATLEIFELIDSKSSGREYGQNPEIKGKIVLKNIKFAYPQRKEATILNDTSIVINPGETIALVGESGSGKSTIMALLEKFYEPDSGFITVDDIDIQDIDTNWLRKSIGYVTQEPKLFSYSLRENLVYGRLVEQPDGEFLPDVTEEEIKKVACDGNIHEFIEGLPEKYQTFAGEKGTQLSGGQKQRIAISRALLKNPKILLLDEATSALDATSERLVQESLDKARVGRTTLIIAHRLSTIKNADKILVFSPLEKRVVEEGTHASLIASKGIYYNFYQKQQMNSE